MEFNIFTISFRNCIIKKGNDTVPYRAIASRTRSKSLKNSSSDEDFLAFISSVAPKSKIQDYSTSTSETTSTSTSDSNTIIYYSPDSVVPGSTSSYESSDVQCCGHDPHYQDQDEDSEIITISSDSENIEVLPGFTQSVNTDLQVSFGQFNYVLQCCNTFSTFCH